MRREMRPVTATEAGISLPVPLFFQICRKNSDFTFITYLYRCPVFVTHLCIDQPKIHCDIRVLVLKK